MSFEINVFVGFNVLDIILWSGESRSYIMMSWILNGKWGKEVKYVFEMFFGKKKKVVWNS